VRTFRPSSSILATLPTLLALAGCGGGEVAEEPMGEMSMPATPAATSAPAATPGQVTAEIRPLPGYQAEGDIRITRDGTQLVIEVIAESHLPQADYPLHIHEGRCAEGGRVLTQLTSVEGQEAGEGRSTSRIDASTVTATGSYFIQIHAPNGTPVGCGDLPPLNL
jgi:hypothetical protein